MNDPSVIPDMKIKKLLKLYFFLSAVLTVCAVAAQTLLFFYSFDNTLFLYERGPLPIVFGVFMLLSVLFTLSAALTAKKSKLPDTLAAPSKPLIFFSALSGFFILATLILNSLYALNGIETDALLGILPITTMILAIPASIYFFVTALNQNPKPQPYAILGISCTVWLIMYSLTVYFHMDMSINSPLHVYNQLALLAAILAFLDETRFALRRPEPARHVAFSLTAMLMLAVSSVPPLILTFALRIPITTDTIYYLAEFALSLFLASRVLSVINGNTTPVITDNIDSEE